jgi:hypothetical protein
LAIAANGSFSSALPSVANYAVTVKNQAEIPTWACTASNGAGTVANGAVANEAVANVRRPVPPAANFAYSQDYVGNPLLAYTIDPAPAP